MQQELSGKKGLFIGNELNYKKFIEKNHTVQFADMRNNIVVLEQMVRENEIQVIFTFAEDSWYANRLLWCCDSVEIVCLVDGDNPYVVEENRNRMTDVRIWDYIAVNSKSEVEAGGWYSSYTGLPFSTQEMDEYANDVYDKLKNEIDEEKTILEIGCASGITMYRLAPYCKKYIGTDMAAVNLEKNRAYMEAQGIHNISLFQSEANQIAYKCHDNVDIVIINSVVQYFPGINYLKQVVEGICQVITRNHRDRDGIIYIGDVMDLDRKDMLQASLEMYKQTHPEAKTKLDLSEELFLPKNYFYYLADLIPEIYDVSISDKEGEIHNELVAYRYDVLLKIREGVHRGNKVLKNINKRQIAIDYFA